MRAALFFVPFLALYIAAAACTPPSGNNYFEITWGDCDGGQLPGIDCGQLNVPLDWSHPEGQHITLGITRLRTKSNSTKIGNLVFNPGGPGGPSRGLCESQAMGVPIFGDMVPAYFDIICPDPRGIGTSTPVSCDPALWNQRQSLFPQDLA